MKLRKIILCVAAALAAFGASIGLYELGCYLTPEPEEDFCVAKVSPSNAQPAQNLTAENLPPSVVVSPSPGVMKPPSLPDVPPAAENNYETLPGGDYYIIGELPKGFKDFVSISFETVDYTLASADKGYQEVDIAPRGYLKTAKQYDFQRVSISPKRFKFETESIGGVSYRFTGKFTEETIDMGDYMASVVLKGTLTKLVKGKKTAEIEVKFETGGC